MRVVQRNLFEAVGLNFEIVNWLNKKQLTKLIIGMSKMLGSFYAEKRKGQPARVDSLERKQELEDLLKKIKNSPESVSTSKESFLRDSLSLAELRKVKEGVARMDETYSESLLQFFIAKIDAGEDNFHVEDLGGCKIRMSDTVYIFNNIKGCHFSYSPKTLCEISISSESGVTKTRDGRKKEFPERRLVACVSPEDIAKARGVREIFKRMENGFLPRTHTRNEIMYGPEWSEKELKRVTLKIAPDDFSKIIYMLTPKIEKGSLVFSISKIEDEIYFTCEGTVLGIERI